MSVDCRHHENFGDSGWPFPVVAAYLRLGEKYEMEHLRMTAVNVLSAAFPSTLDIYNTDEEDVKEFLIFNNASLYFDVISLAREVGMHRFLPAAYYKYCEIFVLDEVLEGVQRLDGTISILSAEDQKVVMRGWHQLVKSQSEHLFWLTLKPGEESNFFIDCETLASNQCVLARRELLCAELYPLKSNYSMLRDSYWRYEDGTQCNQCTYHCNNAQSVVLNYFWNALPPVFGLPAWDKLLQE
jgi:hypothetical protein